MNPLHREDIAGVVLTGGQSKRMGSPKALLSVGNHHLFVHQALILSGLFSSVYISHKPDSFSLPESGFAVLPDTMDEKSPMTGIFSALTILKKPVFVLPVDVPDVSVYLVDYLLEKRNPDQFCSVYYNEEIKVYDPLIGIWELAALPVLEFCLQHQELSFQKLLRTHRIPEIPFPKGYNITNLNTKEDYQQWLAK